VVQRAMPRFGCHCGQSISLSSLPNPYEGRLVWDPEFETWQDAALRGWRVLLEAWNAGKYAEWIASFYGSAVDVTVEQALEDVLARADSVSRAVVRCPECSRLYVQRKPGTNEYDCFRLEPAE
jgi:hypothetical protein